MILYGIFSFVYMYFSDLVSCSIVDGKDLEGEKEFYSNAEWKERVEKWKVRQEKRGLVNKDEGKDDQGEEDDYL